MPWIEWLVGTFVLINVSLFAWNMHVVGILQRWQDRLEEAEQYRDVRALVVLIDEYEALVLRGDDLLAQRRSMAMFN